MTQEQHTTYLIDGSGYIFRAFYAIQSLSTKEGFPTNALYGFIKMTLKTIAQANSSRVAMIFDAGKKTFRNDLYPEYKANRAECPPELAEQMPFFADISQALGLPVLQCVGYEADDIIATLTAKLSAQNNPVVIVSGDKDLMQLVSSTVQIWDTMKDKHYGPDEVIEKFGVPPEQVTEILALTGDTSDNIPGVDGVGPKTASQLVQKFDSVEGVIAAIESLKDDKSIRNRAKISKNIEENLDQLRLSRKLVEVAADVPLETFAEGADDLDTLLTRREIDADHLSELFDRFEFQSLFKELTSILAKAKRKSSGEQFTYRTVYANEFDSWVSTLRSQKDFAFDLETTSLDVHEAHIVGASFCWDDNEAYYIPIRHTTGDDQVSWERFATLMRDIFADSSVAKCGQNVKYDISILELHGISVAGVTFDSMVAAYLLNPDARNFNLTSLASDFLNLSVIEYEAVTKDKEHFGEVSIPDATQYAAQDAHYAWLLKKSILPLITQRGLERVLMELEVPLIPILSKMECSGIKVDADKLRTMSEEFATQLASLDAQIIEEAQGPFNINSPKQLADVLFNRLGIPTKGVKKTKTGLSTNSSVLEKLAESYALPALVLEYRGLHKLKSTYTDALAQQINPKTHRIHTRLNQTITGTGRLSSSEPNLQNIPIQSAAGRRIRTAFIPEEGNFYISADYSQIELRLLAHMSGDENLIAAFNEGHDIHARTAREILGLSSEDELTSEMRRVGKTINFGIVYGMGQFRLAKDLGIPVGEASNYIANYFARYPKVKTYFSGIEESALANGEVETIFGRKRVIGALNTSGRDQGFAMRAAINAPLQGSAADIIKLAMIHVDKLLTERYPDAKLILQIHDELLVEAVDKGNEANEKLMEEITTCMESVMALSVPLKVDAGKGANWQEAQS
jgi:DNA polymerase-1